MQDSLSGELVARVLLELQSLQARGDLADAREMGFRIVTHDDGRIEWEDATTRGRSDCYTLMSESEAAATGLPSLAAAIRSLGAVARNISEGISTSQEPCMCLAPADRTQVSCYPGEGTGYKLHQDVSLTNSGRSNARVLTLILYLNSSWESAHGGHLRLMDATRAEDGEHRSHWDVEPRGGTLVVFDSILLHEVRPTWAKRFALTLWVEQQPAPATATPDPTAPPAASICSHMGPCHGARVPRYSQEPVLRIAHSELSTVVLVEQRLNDSAAAAFGADGTYRRLWPTSLTLSRYLAEHAELVRGRRVVELGAGSGAVGLVCAALGAAHVCITDVPGALQLITDNLHRNLSLEAKGNVRVAPCVWGERTHTQTLLADAGRFDVVIACEVIYKQEWRMLSALLDTMDVLLAHTPDAAILLAYQQRSSVLLDDQAFFGPAAERLRVQKASLRPYESSSIGEGCNEVPRDDLDLALDDRRLMLYQYTRASLGGNTSCGCASVKAATPPPPPAGEETLSDMVARIGLDHLSDALREQSVSQLAQAVLDDRPKTLARLRAAGVHELNERQKLANELTRSAKRRGFAPIRATQAAQGVIDVDSLD